MRVEDYLTNSAARLPRKTALVSAGTRLTYAEFDRLSSGLAAGLRASGIRRGDRVLVFLDNGIDAAIAIFGALKAGAVFSPINASTKSAKLGFIIDNCAAAAVITRKRLATVVADAMERANVRPLTIVTDGAAPALPDALDFERMTETPAIAPEAGDQSDLAMLIYTSGSTGQPKGVMMSHANIDAASLSITTYLENSADDIVLNALPMTFNYGLYQLLATVRVGATLVIEKSFAFPQAVFETMRLEKVTGFPLVPTIAARILGMRDLTPNTFPDLRYITNAAAALPATYIDRLTELFPNTRIFSMYGQTECARGTYLPPELLATRRDSVGIAIPGTDAFVVDEALNRLPNGTIGELAIRGPHVMQGYWNLPEATAAALRSCPETGAPLLCTGDLFYADEEGFLYFVGRKDDIIKTRGEKVAPKEVEAVVLACPGVAEAIVFGRDDAVFGQTVCAMVVKGDGALSEQDVIRHCARNLEDFMVPATIVFRSSLPLAESGKVSRRLAAESLAEETLAS